MSQESTSFPPELLCKACKSVGCCGTPPPGGAVSQFEVQTINSESLAALRAQLDTFKATFTGNQFIEQLHFTQDGGTLISIARVLDDASCTVHLEGTIGVIPYKLDLTVKVDVQKKVVLAIFEMQEPFAFKIEHEFNMVGFFEYSGHMTFSSLEPVQGTSISSLAASGIGLAGINWWCALKCGGISILPTLILCIPAFVAGGPAGYVACVTAKAGETAAKIAVCIATKCL